ncbi:MAG: hypothetical protein KGK12_06735 [Armatimonadetes bacterium]|nr:hypothetical protein [Armatimonadota bacterium]
MKQLKTVCLISMCAAALAGCSKQPAVTAAKHPKHLWIIAADSAGQQVAYHAKWMTIGKGILTRASISGDLVELIAFGRNSQVIAGPGNLNPDSALQAASGFTYGAVGDPSNVIGLLNTVATNLAQNPPSAQPMVVIISSGDATPANAKAFATAAAPLCAVPNIRIAAMNIPLRYEPKWKAAFKPMGSHFYIDPTVNDQAVSRLF